MFTIRPSKVQDSDEIYRQTIKLLRDHENQGENTRISADGFRAIEAEKFMHFRVLTAKVGIKENYFDLCADDDDNYCPKVRIKRNRRGETEADRVVGYIAFEDDYDLHCGGYGILVDQFFIIEEFRGMGQGRRLLNSVCFEAKKRKAKYIKLFYQERKDRVSIYKRLGFKSLSDSSPFISLYEIYGPENVNGLLGLNVFDHFEVKTPVEPVKPGAEVLLYQQASGSPDGLGRIIFHFRLTTNQDGIESSPFPSPSLVVVVQHSKRIHPLPGLFEFSSVKRFLAQRGVNINEEPLNLWIQIARLSTIKEPDNSEILVCAFVERPSVCCWLGHKLIFGNFVGDLSLITKELLIRRIHDLTPKWGPILGIDFEISGRGKEPPSAINCSLIRFLNSLGVQGDDSWKCVVLDKEHIRECPAN
ncbi:hypothetical protein Aperf_G00000057906 [Anoplocephala perfoliata]